MREAQGKGDEGRKEEEEKRRNQWRKAGGDGGERERHGNPCITEDQKIREEISERSEKEVRGSPFFEEREREREGASAREAQRREHACKHQRRSFAGTSGTT